MAFLASPNRQGLWVDVPPGARHRLADEGSEDLVMVEVHQAACTGEDDKAGARRLYGKAS